MWVHRRIVVPETPTQPEKTLYEVGYYEPLGQFWIAYILKTLDEAESKVNYLNGG